MPTPSLPPASLARSLPRGTDVLVVGLTDAGVVGVPAAEDRAYQKAYGAGVAELARALGAKPAAGKIRTLPATPDGPRVLVVGIGSGADPTPEELRRAAGAGVRKAAALADGAPVSIAVSLGSDEPETVAAVAEGALLGTYSYAPISAQEPPATTVASIAVLTEHSEKTLLERAQVVSRAVLAAREWVNIPPNLLYPQSFAEHARALVKDARIAVEILDENALAKAGYGGILAVGAGSSRPPRLVRLAYAPRGAGFHLALVGKGITFDSGGLNLKPGDSMFTMKSDMAGAAAVLAATHAIAQLGLKIKVTVYASLAENMPSDTAYRPSDVLTMYGGKTVENGNTDAEGRLVMADAMVRAGEDNPDLLVDVATLTGAVIVALGDRTAGLMASDDDTADKLLDAAEAAGEDMWQLPIPKDIRPKLDSSVADLRSTGKDRGGGALIAAAFLREFVAPGLAWAHMDIAGPSYHDKAPYGYVSAGGTGYGVRTLVALATALSR